jgi:hypothetical protein
VKASIVQARKDLSSEENRKALVIPNPIIEDVLQSDVYKSDDEIANEFNSLIFAGEHDFGCFSGGFFF